MTTYSLLTTDLNLYLTLTPGNRGKVTQFYPHELEFSACPFCEYHAREIVGCERQFLFRCVSICKFSCAFLVCFSFSLGSLDRWFPFLKLHFFVPAGAHRYFVRRFIHPSTHSSNHPSTLSSNHPSILMCAFQWDGTNYREDGHTQNHTKPRDQFHWEPRE